MLKNVLIAMLGLVSLGALAQQNATLQKQVDFCSNEVKALEKEVRNYKNILEKQQTEITSLKQEIVDKEGEKENLNEKIVDLESASVVLLKVATKLEEQDKLIEALDIFKLITEIYPGTLESSSANFRIRKIHGVLRARASANNTDKK